MKLPNPKFTGMNMVTNAKVQQEISNYYPKSAQGLAFLKSLTTFSGLIDFCIEDYRAWGDAILMGAGAYLKINNYSNEISLAKEYVKTEVETYLKGNPFSSEAEYDAWHEKICLTLSNPTKYFASYSAYRKTSTDNFKNKNGFTIGNAQKFLNMLMKDLYACLNYNSKLLPNYEDYFKYCHMPLDSYILRFVDDIRHREHIKKSARKYTWGNLNSYNSYMDEQNDIRKYVTVHKTNSQTTVLQTEFVVWPLYK